MKSIKSQNVFLIFIHYNLKMNSLKNCYKIRKFFTKIVCKLMQIIIFKINFLKFNCYGNKLVFFGNIFFRKY